MVAADLWDSPFQIWTLLGILEHGCVLWGHSHAGTRSGWVINKRSSYPSDPTSSQLSLIHAVNPCGLRYVLNEIPCIEASGHQRKSYLATTGVPADSSQWTGTSLTRRPEVSCQAYPALVSPYYLVIARYPILTGISLEVIFQHAMTHEWIIQAYLTDLA